MDRGAGRENKQHLFPIEREKVSTLPYLDRGHGVQQCPVEEPRSLCSLIDCLFVCLFSRPSSR